MLKRNENGLYFVSEKTGMMYDLNIGDTIGLTPTRTSDRCFILSTGLTEEDYELWKNDDPSKEMKEEIVGWFYGATFLTDERYKTEYISTIKAFVDEYERRTYYDFTFKDLDWFLGNIEGDALAEFEKTKGFNMDQDKLDIHIRVGDHYVTVPYTDDNYIRLNDYIMECRAETVDIVVKGKEEKEMENTKLNYIVKKNINNSCYPETFQNIFRLLLEKNVDGWYAMEFLSWLYQKASYAADYDVNAIFTEVFFAIYDADEVDMMTESTIKYGMNLEDCMADYNTVNFYRIQMSEDCSLDEIVLKCKTMDEMILETLMAYHLTNKEVLEDWQNKDLENQIEYMKQKIEEDQNGN